GIGPAFAGRSAELGFSRRFHRDGRGRIGAVRRGRGTTPGQLRPQTLLPPSVAFLEREDSHERFHRVDFAVIDLEGFPHRKLVASSLAYSPGHTQPDDA